MPDPVNLRGRVTGADGRGVKDVTVNACTGSIGGAGGATLTATGITDISGGCSVTVLRGTGYQVTFVPRQPQP